MQPYITSARIAGGKLTIRNRKQFDALLATCRDGEYTVTVERAHATRSKAQNDYLHAVVVEAISEHTGYNAKDAKELIKAMHLPQDMAASGENGRLMNGLVIGGHTSRLNKLQFIEFLERVVQWAAEELGVVIQDPDPMWREHAEQERASATA